MTMYRFYRESTGKWEDVPLERWRWEAHYTDGTVLKQFDDENKLFHQFKEIDQPRLSHFSMVTDNKPPLILQWNPSYGKLIHFYNNYRLAFGTDEARSFRVYGFGYENKMGKVILCIMPDDGVVITDDHNKITVK